MISLTLIERIREICTCKARALYATVTRAKECMKLHDARRSARFPRRTHRPLGILGPHGRQQKLARLSFGKIKIPLTRDEFAAINQRAESYLRSNGTLFGFVRHLLNA